jgi:branched-chain amino acid transport system permease protein
MVQSDIKKFFVYSLFLGILVLPLVGFATTTFNASRAFLVWGVFVGILAFGLITKSIRNSGGYGNLSDSLAPARKQIKDKLTAVPAKYYIIALLAFAVSYPMVANRYLVDVGITCLIYIVLGLGLNIVVGLAGLLDLGYIAFYAVGAYTYSLLNLNFGIPFWFCIPIGIGFGCIAGCIIGYPTLKMRGDYLAIVTMGFGEIIRLMLNNWDNLTAGPNGLYGMAKPALIYPSITDGSLTWVTFHMKSLESLYFLVLGIAVITVIGVRRLDHSRIGRAWVAIREDEVAAELSGVPTMWLKLLAYALGASFASVVGGFFAAKLSYTNPNFFIFMESCIVLCIVVLGGVGSTPGVIVAAVILSAVPEIFRELQSYRMLAFGAAMAAMMVLKPEGLIPASRRKRELHASEQPLHEES